LRYISVLVVVVILFVVGCGGGATGVSGGPPNTVSGVVTTSAAFSTGAPVRIETRRGPGPHRLTAGLPRSIPDQVLVKFRTGVSPTQASESNRLAGTTEVRSFTRTGVTLVRVMPGQSVDSVISRYRSDPQVAYAEPNYLRYLMAAPRVPLATTPNDPDYPFQWHYGAVNLPSAWDVTTGSSLVIVAVIDTGILFNHPDISGVTVAGFDFVDNDSNPQDTLPCPAPDDFAHGTHVAGTVAAATNNGIGVAGVNWGGSGRTKIMPLRVFGYIGSPPACTATSDAIIAAIEYAADHSARVINMSFGGAGFSQAEQDAVNYAHNVGVVLAAAAGNENTSCSNTYPANYANVIGVAATSITNVRASYSNFGVCVDLAAPGGDGGPNDDLNGDQNPDWVLSTAQVKGQPLGYYWSAGTSMATPHVAGLAALLISKGVTGPSSVESVMKSTATNLGASLGSGLINAGAALGAPATPNPVKVFAGTITGNAITHSGDIVNAGSNGAYVVTNVPAGTWTIFGWQDTNGSGAIDASDLYGSVGGIVVGTGAGPAGINFSVKEVPAGSTPITVSGTRTGSAMAASSLGG
jgi:serine protease